MSLMSLMLLSTLVVAICACPYLDGAETKGSPPHPRDESSSMHRQLRQRQTQAIAPPANLAGAIDLVTKFVLQLDVDRPDTNWAAKFLRLSFHDCVGGCDGCVDLANPSNFGLDVPIDALDPITVTVASFLTVADVWALAGLVGAQEHHMPSATKVLFPLDLVGRPSCPGNAIRAGPHRELPKAHFTTQQVVDFFSVNFGYTPKESVAILGAHSVGRAFSENSGFNGEGGWDFDPRQLNNAYYKSLLSSRRFNLLSNPPVLPSFPTENFFWEAEPDSGGHFMFHTDMALAFDLSAHMDDPSTGHVTCVMNVVNSGDVLCPRTSSLLPHALSYSQSNEQFLIDFQKVFTKLINTGCGNGVCRPAIAPSTNAPLMAPTTSPIEAVTKSPTSAPVPSPTKAPVPSPTNAPVASPTSAPVPAPTIAPLPAPTLPPARAPTGSPIIDVKDTCKPGFTLINNVCVSVCDMPCPANSVRIPGRQCYDTFNDCQCNAGFRRGNNQCVKDCSSFVCPANSVRIPNRRCYSNFDDCQCNSGFKAVNGQCVS